MGSGEGGERGFDHVIGAGGARLVMVAATMHRRWTDQHRTPFAAPG
jgi:hypothetical protein